MKPGVIEHVCGAGFPIGELNGDITSFRVRRVSGALIDAGFKSPIVGDIRGELWEKLWGNVAMNPLSALTHATLEQMCSKSTPGRAVVESVMGEVENIMSAFGYSSREPLKRQVDGVRKVGAHKTSMLADVEKGNAMEVGGVIGAVVELARITHVKTPALDTLYNTLRMLEWVLVKNNGKISVQSLE